MHAYYIRKKSTCDCSMTMLTAHYVILQQSFSHFYLVVERQEMVKENTDYYNLNRV